VLTGAFFKENSTNHLTTHKEKIKMNDFLEKINNLFNDPELRAKLVTYRWPLAIAAAIIFILLMEPQYFLIGLLISLVGEGLQVWCFATLNKKKDLAAKGPYAVIRNPMYIGRYLLILGAVAITGSLFLMVVYTIIYYFYMTNRVGREEEVLKDIFGDAYLEYCNNVNRFIPTLKRLDKDEILYFNWDLFFSNNAHWNILSVIVGYWIAYIWIF